MDGTRFDTWTKTLALPASRRRVLAALAAGAFGFVRVRPATALTCRGAGDTCREDGDCCSGFCGPQDWTRRRRCECPASTVTCASTCVDPTTAFQNDPSNCGACGNRCPDAPCLRPICTDGVCGLEANPDAVGTACDDGNACTENDVCQADGSCAGTGSSVPPPTSAILPLATRRPESACKRP